VHEVKFSLVIKRRGISITHLNHAVFSGTGFMPPTWNVEDPPLEGWIEGEYMRPATRVVVEEVKSGDL